MAGLGSASPARRSGQSLERINNVVANDKVTLPYQGMITDWKDDKGFGFILPNAGGARVFLHVTAFENRSRVPQGSELVTYELSADERGRPRAINVAFVGEKRTPPPASAPGPGLLALFFAVAVLALVAWAVAAGRLPRALLLAYTGMSTAAYLTYAFDKLAALKNRRRVPENVLHMLGLLGGWPGAALAQKTMRHKTQKRSFQVAFWITVALNCAALGWLLR